MMEESAWSTPYGRFLSVACLAAAVAGFVLSAGLLTRSGGDDTLGEKISQNFEAAAENLEAAADVADYLPPLVSEPAREAPRSELAGDLERQADALEQEAGQLEQTVDDRSAEPSAGTADDLPVNAL
jgi:hypothetical protein